MFSNNRLVFCVPVRDKTTTVVANGSVMAIHQPETDYWHDKIFPLNQPVVKSFSNAKIFAPFECVIADFTDTQRGQPDYTAFNNGKWGFSKLQIYHSILSSTGCLLVWLPADLQLCALMTSALTDVGFKVRKQPEILHTQPRPSKNTLFDSKTSFIIVAHKDIPVDDEDEDNVAIVPNYEETGFYESTLTRNTHTTSGFAEPLRKYSLQVTAKGNARRSTHGVKKSDKCLYPSEYNLAVLIRLIDTYSNPGGSLYHGQGGGGMAPLAVLRLNRYLFVGRLAGCWRVFCVYTLFCSFLIVCGHICYH